MQVLKRANAIEHEMVVKDPKLRVRQGEVFKVETEDSLLGAVRDEDTLPIEEVLGPAFARGEGNPCAGPVYVEGAVAGDILEVTIEDIVVDEQGVSCIFEGGGPLAGLSRYPDCQGPLTKVIRHEPGPSGTTSDGRAIYDERLSFPLNPHVGTIGVAPLRPIAAGVDTCVGQSRAGGNFDSQHLRKGSKILLPVEVDGAYLYLGDVHASMADTEFTGAANETRAEVTLSCRVVGRGPIPWPRVIVPEGIIQLSCAKPLEAAVRRAMVWMIDWLVEDYGYSARDAYLNMSVNPGVKVHVYQMVEEGRLNFTVGVLFPRESLTAYQEAAA